MRICAFTFSVDEMLMLCNIERTNFKKLFLKVSHVLHCAFLDNIDTEVVLYPDLSGLFGKFEMINSAKQAGTFIADVLLPTLPLHFYIQRLEFNRFSKGGMKTRKDGAS